jgi:hypothetical protein
VTIASSLAVAAPAAGQRTVTMSVSKRDERIRYGEHVAVRGSADAGQTVRLEYAPRGGGYREVARDKADARGDYAFRASPRQSGSLRAVADGAGASAPRHVTVVARLSGAARRHLRRGAVARVAGRLRPALTARTIYVQVRAGGRWRTVDRARTGRGGHFRAAWRVRRVGSFPVRVRFRGDRRNGAATRRLRGRVNVYRPGLASWYGPGMYGNRTSCGRTLSAGTLGVANKHLPCGTLVTFRYRGRSVTAPVIDRGPYAGGREWDLTAATKRRLRFPSTGTVWSTK